ncbi:monovalent cation/H(+) antiporter subunit G [Actinotalea sp. AC32]|nr:monovalent cation/H(+) antiporter subunit G [Actinotalea sp. AC32]
MNDTLAGVLDAASSVVLLAGALLTFAAGVGVVRFPDLLARTHVGAKPQVLGLMLVLLGLELRLRTLSAMWVMVLVVLFQLLTSPVTAHMVSRAGFRTGKVDHDRLVVDELTRDMERADGDGPRVDRGRPGDATT